MFDDVLELDAREVFDVTSSFNSAMDVNPARFVTNTHLSVILLLLLMMFDDVFEVDATEGLDVDASEVFDVTCCFTRGVDVNLSKEKCVYVTHLGNIDITFKLKLKPRFSTSFNTVSG